MIVSVGDASARLLQKVYLLIPRPAPSVLALAGIKLGIVVSPISASEVGSKVKAALI